MLETAIGGEDQEQIPQSQRTMCGDLAEREFLFQFARLGVDAKHIARLLHGDQGVAEQHRTADQTNAIELQSPQRLLGLRGIEGDQLLSRDFRQQQRFGNPQRFRGRAAQRDLLASLSRSHVDHAHRAGRVSRDEPALVQRRRDINRLFEVD